MDCPACGASVDAEARYCEVCGSPIGIAVVDAIMPTGSSAFRRELEVGPKIPQNEDAVVVISKPPFAALVVCDGVSMSHDPARGAAAAAGVLC